MSPRLHILLGQGGVGKTTLACGYALALGEAGRRVGLLGVDPAGRLRTALGLETIGELPLPLREAASVSAALLRPGESLRRWAAEECKDDAARERLLRNPFFLALADRLAGATDALAAIRVAEWAEQDPALDDLVVDTAPGLHGLEFLAKPDKLLALLQGRLLRWVSSALVAGRRPSEAVGRRVLRGLSGIAGLGVLVELAEFSILVEGVAAAMIARLERARDWLRRSDTEILLVCVPRPDAAAGVRQLADELRRLRLEPGPIVLNRALPAEFATLRPAAPCASDARAFATYVRGSARLQAELARELDSTRLVDMQPGLDGRGAARVAALRELGRRLTAMRSSNAAPAARTRHYAQRRADEPRDQSPARNEGISRAAGRKP